MHSQQQKTPVRAVLFDFGGVVAEEGFREGLQAIAKKFGLDPEQFFSLANEAVYGSGYVTGQANEAAFWAAVRSASGINSNDAELRREILDRFIVRPEMIAIVHQLHHQKTQTVILSDQSNWLDILDQRYHFFQEFDRIYNSYYLGKSKRDETLFTDIARKLDLEPAQCLLVDDNRGHTERARARGLQAHLFRDPQTLRADLGARGLI